MIKRLCGIICLGLTPMLVLAAISSLSRKDSLSVTNETGLGGSQMVGAFLPVMIFLILGLWLLQKPKPKDGE